MRFSLCPRCWKLAAPPFETCPNCGADRLWRYAGFLSAVGAAVVGSLMFSAMNPTPRVVYRAPDAPAEAAIVARLPDATAADVSHEAERRRCPYAARKLLDKEYACGFDVLGVTEEAVCNLMSYDQAAYLGSLRCRELHNALGH